MKQPFQVLRTQTNVIPAERGFRGIALAVDNRCMGGMSGAAVGLSNSITSIRRSCGVFAAVDNDSANISGLTLGAFNILEEKNEGVVIGGYNDVELFRGVIAGLMNVGEKVSGMMVGLFNMAEDFKGVQVGILNVRDNAPWYARYVPIVAIRTGKAPKAEK